MYNKTINNSFMEKIKLNMTKTHFDDNLYKYWKKAIYYNHKKSHIQFFF